MNKTKINTLILIGNGFDRWQGLDTSYSSFCKFYKENIKDVLKKLHIKEHKYISNGVIKYNNDVDIVYGDALDTEEIDDEFWLNFEDNLSNINSLDINLRFGKEVSEIRYMNKCIKNAKRILTEMFCRWIQSINVDNKDSGYVFGDNCLIINFNYTDTVKKRFGINPINEFHIHGSADNKKSIIFGHSDHPQPPFKFLKRFGSRFKQLYILEKLLYETDKQAHLNILALCTFLSSHHTLPEDFEHVYILGKSISVSDFEYFALLGNIFAPGIKTKKRENIEIEMGDAINYVVEKYGYNKSDNDIEKRLRLVGNQIRANYYNAIDNNASVYSSQEEENYNKKRRKFPMWHVCTYNESDKEKYESFFRMLHFKNYEFKTSIDDTIEKFKK